MLKIVWIFQGIIPAYDSNILVGDIIIQFDGVKINNTSHFLELAKDYDVSKGKVILKIIRGNEIKDIEIFFNS